MRTELPPVGGGWVGRVGGDGVGVGEKLVDEPRAAPLQRRAKRDGSWRASQGLSERRLDGAACALLQRHRRESRLVFRVAQSVARDWRGELDGNRRNRHAGESFGRGNGGTRLGGGLKRHRLRVLVDLEDCRPGRSDPRRELLRVLCLEDDGEVSLLRPHRNEVRMLNFSEHCAR